MFDSSLNRNSLLRNFVFISSNTRFNNILLYFFECICLYDTLVVVVLISQSSRYCEDTCHQFATELCRIHYNIIYIIYTLYAYNKRYYVCTPIEGL